MDFRLLGPLEVRDGDREVRLRGGKQRALLALLLVNANRTLGIDRIVDDLWGEDVPETAAKMVQIYVSRLRKVLGAEALRTRPPGYALELEPGELDLHRFERLLGDGARGARRGPGRGGVTWVPGRPRAVAGARARGVHLGAVRAGGGGEARGASRLRARGPARGRPPARATRRSGRRAGGADRPLSAPRGPAAAADAGAVPIGPAGGGAGRVSGGEARARRRARHRAFPGAARPRAAHPPAGPEPGHRGAAGSLRQSTAPAPRGRPSRRRRRRRC